MATTMSTYPAQQQPAPSRPAPNQSAATRGVAVVAALAIAACGYYVAHRHTETVPGSGHGHGRGTVARSGWAAPLAAFAPLIGSKPGAADAWSSAQCGPVPSSDKSVVTNIACTEPDESTINVVVFRSAAMVDQIVRSAGEQGDDIRSWSQDPGTSMGQVIIRSTGTPYVATTFANHPTVIVEVSGLADVGALTADWRALPLPQ